MCLGGREEYSKLLCVPELCHMNVFLLRTISIMECTRRSKIYMDRKKPVSQGTVMREQTLFLG